MGGATSVMPVNFKAVIKGAFSHQEAGNACLRFAACTRTNDATGGLFVEGIGVNALQTLGRYSLGSYSPFILLFPLPRPFLPFSSPPPLIQGLGERCKLLSGSRVRAEPGHQTHFGAFRDKNEAFQWSDFLYF